MEAELMATAPDALRDRALGALMGAFVGEALGVGPHWYYDLEQLVADYGPWIDTYTYPKPGRYHVGLEPGAPSQSGILLEMTLRSLVDCGDYDEADFCRRLDTELFPELDGTSMSGPGGYTSQSIRDAWRKRVQEGRAWGSFGSDVDNTEAAERIIAIAVRYALNLPRLAWAVTANTALTQTSSHVIATTTTFGAVLGMLVEGHRFDAEISDKLMGRIKADKRISCFNSAVQPPHTAAQGRLEVQIHTDCQPCMETFFPSHDALVTPSGVAKAAHDPGVRIEPASKVGMLYGLPCAVHHQFPAAYYLAARFQDDFESAVLHALNAGGQNQARAMLTGALSGAMVGLSGIPRRFIDGLERAEVLLALAERLVGDMESRAQRNDSHGYFIDERRCP